MITREKLEHHIAHLQEKHDKLDTDIIQLQEHHEESLKIESLKKLKLHLKDEIERFKLQMNSL